MTTNIVPFTGDTTLDIDPDKILAASLGHYPGGVLVIGYGPDGLLQYQTSFNEARDVLWALKNTEFDIMAEFGG